MESPQPPTSDRKKLLRSCNPCRVSKTRCLPEGDNDDLCQRCRRLGKECVFAEARGRAKGQKRFPHSKLADVEKRINDIYSILSHENTPASDASFTVVPNDLSTSPIHPARSIASPDGPRTASTPGIGPSTIALTPVSTQTSEISGRADAIQRGIISYNEAEEFLSIYNAELAYACYIWPSGNTDLGTMRREHPLALLAALIVAAPEKSQVRERLHREFKETVARKFIVDFNMKDLDLLRGVMLYTLWYSVYPNCDMAQIYTWSHTAVTLCADLNVGTYATSQPLTAEKLDLCRLYLATYLATCSTSLGLRKPIPMPYGDTIQATARYLASVKQNASDECMVRITELQRIKESIGSIFGFETPNSRPLILDTVELTISAFAREIEAIENEPPIPEPFFQELLTLSLLHSRVVLHQVALLIQRPQTAPATPSSTNNPTSTSQTTRRRTLLLRCADSAKAYLTYFCSLPNRLHESCTTIHRCQLAHSAILLLKLAFSTYDATPSNPLPLRNYCNMAPFMDTLCDTCRDHTPEFCASRGGTGVCVERDRIAHFREKVRRLKMWYERLDSFGGVGAVDSLGDLSTVNLERIERQEEMMFDLDFSGIDFGGLGGEGMLG